MASALMNGSPMLVLGGRAPAVRWGQGSLQEIDHIPFVAPLTKLARTAEATAEIPALVDEALRATARAADRARVRRLPAGPGLHGGDPWTRDATASLPDPTGAARAPTATRSTARPSCCARAERPVVMAGTGLYWARGEHALRALCEELQIPVFLNGLARGCVPADHPMFFSRARGARAEGRRRRARGRRADGLPARLRRLVRRGHADRS